MTSQHDNPKMNSPSADFDRKRRRPLNNLKEFTMSSSSNQGSNRDNDTQQSSGSKQSTGNSKQGSHSGSRQNQSDDQQSQSGGRQSNSQSGSSGDGRGFASMDPDRQREIAAEGGRAAHASGHAHEFTSEEAREAGSMSHKNDGNKQSDSDNQSSRSSGSQGGHTGNQGGPSGSQDRSGSRSK